MINIPESVVQQEALGDVSYNKNSILPTIILISGGKAQLYYISISNEKLHFIFNIPIEKLINVINQVTHWTQTVPVNLWCVRILGS